jgi:hypothetical protein
MYQIPELEAINRIMSALDGTIVESLSTPGNDTVIQAQRALQIATEKIQMENQWNFNFDGPRQLQANGNGNIIMPPDYLYVNFYDWDSGSVFDLTVRDNMAYDRRNFTNQVAGKVHVGGSVLIQYVDCAAIVQNYIIERTKVEFVGEAMQISAPRIQIYAQQAKDAYIALEKWDAQQKFGTLDIFPNQRDSLRRPGNGGGWWFSGS